MCDNRYFLFGGDHYYPAGGWRDFLGDFPMKEDAIEMLSHLSTPVDWAHVVDIKTNQIVWTK